MADLTTRRILVSFAAYLAILSIGAVIGFGLAPDGSGRLVFASGLLLAALLSILYAKISWSHYTASVEHEGPRGVEVELGEVAKAEAEFSLRMTDSLANEFIQLIGTPTWRYERITESVEAMTRSISISTTYTVATDVSTKRTLHVVPTVLLPRGELADGLKVFGPGGERVSTFSRAHAAGYFLCVVETLLLSAGYMYLAAFTSVGPAPYRGKSLKDELIGFLVASQPNDPREVEAWTEELNRMPTAPSADIVLRTISYAVRELTFFYPLLVEFTQDAEPEPYIRSRVVNRISCVRRSVPARRQAPVQASVIPRSGEWLRRWMGISPAQVSLPLAAARRARSYHIQIKGPEGSYLGRQRLAIAPESTDLKIGDLQYTMQRRQGQRHSHLYIHGGHSISSTLHEDMRNVVFENHFFERMPGSVGRATMSALAAAVLILIASSSRIGMASLGGADLVAALLALPAIAGAWSSFEQKTQVVGESLASRLSAVITVGTSLFAAWSYTVLPSAELDSFERISQYPWAWLWSLLAVLAVLNVSAMAFCWCYRSIIQAKFLSRDLST